MYSSDAPFICNKCHFIFDTIRSYNEHKKLCLEDPEQNKILQLSDNRDYYSKDAICITNDRCWQIIQKGNRKGRYCLKLMPCNFSWHPFSRKDYFEWLRNNRNKNLLLWYKIMIHKND